MESNGGGLGLLRPDWTNNRSPFRGPTGSERPVNSTRTVFSPSTSKRLWVGQ